MATNENVNNEIIASANETEASNTSEASSMYDDIDAACELIDNAKKDRDKKKADEDKKAADAAAKKAENAAKLVDELERQKEEDANAKRIQDMKSIRAFRKKCAKNMVFWMSAISAMCTTCIFGIFIWYMFEPVAWVFATVMSAIGMLNTIIYTYLYRYIREAIYRK